LSHLAEGEESQKSPLVKGDLGGLKKRKPFPFSSPSEGGGFLSRKIPLDEGDLSSSKIPLGEGGNRGIAFLAVWIPFCPPSCEGRSGFLKFPFGKGIFKAPVAKGELFEHSSRLLDLEQKIFHN